MFDILLTALIWMGLGIGLLLAIVFWLLIIFATFTLALDFFLEFGVRDEDDDDY